LSFASELYLLPRSFCATSRGSSRSSVPIAERSTSPSVCLRLARAASRPRFASIERFRRRAVAMMLSNSLRIAGNWLSTSAMLRDHAEARFGLSVPSALSALLAKSERR
jgi:hypothetical protein